MKISVVPADGIVGVDEVLRPVDLSDFDSDVHVMQFDTALNKGRIWFKAETNKGQADLTDIAPYQIYLDRWTAYVPPPSPSPPLPPRLVLDAEEAVAVKGDAQVQTFLNFSPAELDAWVDANIPVGGQRTAFKMIGRIALAAGRGKTLR